MTAEIVIPWGGPRPILDQTPLESIRRDENLQKVIRHLWKNGFENRTLCVTPPPREAWSPGRARNLGAEQITGKVVVFNDADSICPPEQIREAVRLAEEAPGLVFAYDLYVRLDESESEMVRRLDTAEQDEWFAWPHQQLIHNSGSMACVAISRACFEQVGGFDESYEGWGYEDLDFAQRCGTLWPNRRVSGPVFHLWHGERNADDSPADSDPAQVEVNRRRWQSLASTF